MSISKKLRFEVFKRDKFTCQYCGRKTPNVILEIDHIIPKKESGSDDIQNLITSCFECNRGKTGTPLNQVFVRKDLKEDLYALAEKELQLREYNKLLDEKKQRQTSDLKKVNQKINEILGGGWGLNEDGKRGIQFFLTVLPLSEILDALDLAHYRLGYRGKIELENDLFRYACGILHRRRKGLGSPIDEENKSKR